MSLNAWEQQALDSIKDGLAGSDPELTALLSAFDRLASDEEMPAREKTPAGPRWALWRFRRARWCFSLRRVRQRRAVLLLWLLATAVLIAVALALGLGGGRGTCTETVAMACVGPASGHSPGSPSPGTTTGQGVWQGAAVIPQAGP